MHHRRSLLLLGALGLAACAEAPISAPTSELSGGLMLSSVQGARSYLIIGKGNNLPANLGESVSAAGGAVTSVLSGIGIATATSSDPGFAAKAGRATGADVVEDVTLNFEQPTVMGEVTADQSDVNFSETAVGATETFSAVQWAPKAISAPAAWDLGYQGAGARVAILDGGIYSIHPDIAANLDVAHSASFVPGQPFNFDAARNAAGVCGGANDTFWHGTHVAGIVAAAANNFITVGIAPKATIIGVKVLHCGSGSFGQVISGIYYAATPIAEGGAGADIINMSLGAVFQVTGDGAAAGGAQLLAALSRATSYANHRNVTVVVAAGNDGVDLDHTANVVSVPAQSVGVIAVAALGPVGFAFNATNFDRPASYTNFGQSFISLAAPGGDFALPGNAICNKPRFPSGTFNQFCWALDMVVAPCKGTSTPPFFSACWAAGTSMAAPHVAGVAALIVGKYGNIGPTQVEQLLRKSADDLGKPGNDDFYGGGRINALRAVQ